MKSNNRGGAAYAAKNAQDRLWKILTPVLLVLAVLAMAKTLFVGLEIDEEYAFSWASAW